MAGVAQTVAASPTELIKCKLQVEGGSQLYRGSSMECARQIVKANGLMGLMAGFNITLLRDSPAYAVYFGSYELSKRRLCQAAGIQADHEAPMWALLTAGGVAGICSWGISIPMDVVKSIIQTLPDSTPRHQTRIIYIARQIYLEQGYQAFFRGGLPIIVRAIPTNAVTLALYDWSISWMNRRWPPDQ